ncbi:DUF2480 family protein [Cytophaga aurantiaca]|uniref:DUF2480 family protein n=1 Tax=Cytophaga aurantiaca TaxID=29530 RepID=UPI00035CB613|nr:DUF2480 family protein [Cytophaga aurantiaca]
MSSDTIINKVQQSGLITIDLEDYYHPGEKVLFDIKDYLYEGIILKEKDFRTFLKEHNWEQYEGKNVAITCSVDAIIPTWAYMLVATKLQPVANLILFGTIKDLHAKIFSNAIAQINASDYTQSKVVIKGCGKLEVPVSAYVELTNKLLPVVSSIMYGEPCSTVPVYKQLK